MTSFIRSRSVAFLIPVFVLAEWSVLDTRPSLSLVLLFAGACAIVLSTPPRLVRPVVPMLALAMAALGFLNARGYLAGFFVPPSSPEPVVPLYVNLRMPLAAAFAVVGAWLYVRLDSPGAARLVAAFRGLRGRAGVSSWPASAIVLALVLGAEVLSGSGGATPVPALTVLLAVTLLAMLLLVGPNPRVAMFVAVLALLLIGLDGIAIARHWPSSAALQLYGFAQVDDEYMAMAVGFQAGLVILADAWIGWKFLQDITAGGRTVELTQRVETLTRTRAYAVDSAAAELRRIERDLHDGAQARLVALGMNLRVAERVLKTDPDAALSLVSEARDVSSRALSELRALVRGIYPPVLADRGLVDAIRALALDMPVRTVVDADLPGTPELPVASAVYFSVAEALTNVTRHAQARSAQVRLEHRGGMLRAIVTDDGVGGADPSLGTGLHGVERRLTAFDGILAISSPAGGPTIVVIEVPCALS
jgi:signal transduction histidine kinase